MKLLPLALLCLCAAPVWAAPANVKVGDTEIHIPSPDGFVRCDGVSKEMDTYDTQQAVGNRVLAMFCKEEDLAKLKSGEVPYLETFLTAQVSNALENTQMSDFTFGVETKDLEKTLGPDQIIPENKYKNVGTSEARITGITNFGIYDKSVDFAAFTMMAQVKGDGLERTKVVSTALVNLHGKVITLAAGSGFHGKSDLDWTRESLKAWKTELFRINPGFPYMPVTVSHTPQADPDAGVVKWVLIGIFGFIGWLIRNFWVGSRPVETSTVVSAREI